MMADFVYHFMPLHRRCRKQEDLNHVKAAILRSEYFFGNPLNFNDPFDCKPNFRLSGSNSHKYSDIRNQLRNALSKIGIFCVAEELYNTLMWSHYTNGHRGVALQFSTHKIREAIKDIGIVDKVTYQNSLPTIKGCGTNEKQQIRKIVFRKSKRWEYENEFRIVLYDAKNRVQSLSNMPVRNIYFGCKIEKQDENELIDALKQKESRVYKMQMCKDRFAYSRKPLEV